MHPTCHLAQPLADRSIGSGLDTAAPDPAVELASGWEYWPLPGESWCGGAESANIGTPEWLTLPAANHFSQVVTVTPRSGKHRIIPRYVLLVTMPGMPARTRALDDARRIWHRTESEVGDQLRTGRHILGLTLKQVGAAIGVSESEISRRELGKSRRLTGEKLAVHAAAVGLKLSVKLWPVGGGIRDAAQVRYIGAFIARVGRAWHVTLEAPIRLPGDLRAVDILLVAGSLRIAVEVVTRLADLQAQVRAAQLKARDVEATRLVLVVAGTHANRNVLAAARTSLVAGFDLDTRRLMADLAAGRDPGRDGIVVL